MFLLSSVGEKPAKTYHAMCEPTVVLFCFVAGDVTPLVKEIPADPFRYDAPCSIYDFKKQLSFTM